MTKNIFAVQYIIEETEPVRGWDSADHFISNVEELVTDASTFKVLSVTSKEVPMNEGVKHLSVVPINEHIFVNEEEKTND